MGSGFGKVRYFAASRDPGRGAAGSGGIWAFRESEPGLMRGFGGRREGFDARSEFALRVSKREDQRAGPGLLGIIEGIPDRHPDIRNHRSEAVCRDYC